MDTLGSISFKTMESVKASLKCFFFASDFSKEMVSRMEGGGRDWRGRGMKKSKNNNLL